MTDNPVDGPWWQEAGSIVGARCFYTGAEANRCRRAIAQALARAYELGQADGRRAHAAGVVEGLRRAAWTMAEARHNILTSDLYHLIDLDIPPEQALGMAAGFAGGAEALADLADELEARQGEQDGD